MSYILRVLFSILLLSVALPSWGGFGIECEENVPSPSNDTETLRYAIEGRLCEPEPEICVLPFPEADANHYYVRGRVNASSLILNHIKNKSGSINQPGIVIKNRAVKNQAGLEVAVGYIWSGGFRADIEYLINNNLKYSSNPGMIGAGVTPGLLQVSVKNNTFLLNVYYDFIGLGTLQPYVTLGVGLGYNSALSRLSGPIPPRTGGRPGTLRTWNVAGAAGVGMRLGIFCGCYLDVSYRGIAAGLTRIQPISGYKLESPYRMSAFSIGLMFLF